MNNTERLELRAALGLGLDDGAGPAAPANPDCFNYVAHGPSYYNASGGSDVLKSALRIAADIALADECKAIVWDYRGDTAAYKPGSDPRPIAVVGVTWLGG